MISTKYLPEALFFLSASYAIFKWTVRTAAQSIEPNDVESSAELELPYMLPALLARGAAPAEELARLTPRERVAMYRTVFDADERGEARMSAGAGWSATCPACGAPVGAGTIPVGYLVRCARCDAELPGTQQPPS